MINRALLIAKKSHNGQFRKYTGEDYINHPIRVAEIVSSVTDDTDMIEAALLHDTVEDTPMTYEGLLDAGISKSVVGLVVQLTKQSLGSQLSRKDRKKIDMDYLSSVSDRAKTIKLADVINNMPSVIKYAPKFAETYIAENNSLISVLKNGGNPALYAKAKSIIDCYYNSN